MTIEQNESLTKKPLFNPQGDLDVRASLAQVSEE